MRFTGILFIVAFQFLRCAAQFEINVVKSDATSVILSWTPLPGVNRYEVYRDTNYIGYTVAKTGNFSDFNLDPEHIYNYRVVAVNENNLKSASSPVVSVKTKSTVEIRTRYTVLALAFYPGAIDSNELVHIRTYFKHRLNFFKLASAGSAVIEPYNQDIITINASPAIRGSGSFNVDYAGLVTARYVELGGSSIVELVEKGDIDFVWVVKAPEECLFYENYLMGNKDIGSPGSTGEIWISDKIGSSRSFFVNAYLPDERCNDAYCHMFEGVMSSMCDGYPEAWPREYLYQVYSNDRADFITTMPRYLHLFERFRLADQWNGAGRLQCSSSGNANCGSSHFPPNSRRDVGGRYDGDYAYYDKESWTRYVDCYADDWFNFPEFRNSKRKINGYDFGASNFYKLNDHSYSSVLVNSPEKHESFSISPTLYHQWWFNHIPHNPGVSNGRLNNWWPYIFDFNRFNGDRIDYEVTGFPVIPEVFQPVNFEYGTDETTPDHWGYCSPGGKNGQISILTGPDNPGHVKSGNSSVRIKVESSEKYNEVARGDNIIFFPRYRNAHWNLTDLDSIRFSIKPDENPGLFFQSNPIVRLCSNGGNRIELIPLDQGIYANLFLDNSLSDPEGWFTFSIPVRGNSKWERNLIGFIDPALDPIEKLKARYNLEKDILSEVNYIEIVINTSSPSTPVQLFSILIDDLKLHMRDSLAPSAAGFITGEPVICLPARNITYSVAPIEDAVSYIWELPYGAVGSSDSNSISVSFEENAMSGNLRVKGHNEFGVGTESELPVTIHFPLEAGKITGSEVVCKNGPYILYSIPAVQGSMSYSWTLPAGASGTSSTRTINVNFYAAIDTGEIIVRAYNECGYGKGSMMRITCIDNPRAPVITLNDSLLQSDAMSGNQWFCNSLAIQNAVGITLKPTLPGEYYVIATENTCSSPPSNVILFYPSEPEGFMCYPNPTSGTIEIHFGKVIKSKYYIEIYNNLGILLQKSEKQKYTDEDSIDLDGYPSGIYTIVIHSSGFTEHTRIIKI